MMAPETVVTVETNKHPQHHQAPPPNQQAGALDWLKIDLEYFQTVPGILKLIELVFGIICMACASPAFLGGSHFFLFVATVSFISTLIWTFVYLLSVRNALRLPINWSLSEFFNTALTTVFYLLAFIVQLSTWGSVFGYGRGSNITAGVFGLFNTLAYAASCYFCYIEHKNSNPELPHPQ